MSDLLYFGEDLGMGANKLFGPQGGLQCLAQVALNGGPALARLSGLSAQRPPLHIEHTGGSFFVGPGAHDWGRPVESLDYERLTGAPESVALLFATLTRYIQAHGPLAQPLHFTVGLPSEMLTGAEAASNVERVRRWLKGLHTWEADAESFSADIAEVKVTSQPVGALFDYLLDDDGQFIAARKAAFTQEVGIISVGFNTVELLVVRDKAPVQRFSAGATSGVRRLLEMVNTERLYSLGELDVRLRAGQLDVRDALPVWEREVLGAIERQWGRAWRRFTVVLVVGGGALLLRDSLMQRFNGKAIVPEEPVLSIARGLYKLGLYQSRAKRA